MCLCLRTDWQRQDVYNDGERGGQVQDHISNTISILPRTFVTFDGFDVVGVINSLTLSYTLIFPYLLEILFVWVINWLENIEILNSIFFQGSHSSNM